MPSSLPPLPPEIGQNQGKPDTQGASAFSGGASSTMQAVQQIEDGYKKLAMSSATFVPFCAQAISQLRVLLPDATSGAGAGASPMGGPPGTSPAITGMAQNPTALPAPPPMQ